MMHGSGQQRAARVAGAGGGNGYNRVAFRNDGSRVSQRGYSAVSARPFNTGTIRTFFRRR
jgi:hypothetical protein